MLCLTIAIHNITMEIWQDITERWRASIATSNNSYSKVCSAVNSKCANCRPQQMSFTVQTGQQWLIETDNSSDSCTTPNRHGLSLATHFSDSPLWHPRHHNYTEEPLNTPVLSTILIWAHKHTLVWKTSTTHSIPINALHCLRQL